MNVSEEALNSPEGRKSWYAVQVKPRHERIVAELFRQKEVESYLPLHMSRRRWSDRVKELPLPLFPGYVFAHVDVSRRLPVLTTAGVVRIIGAGSCPISVPDVEMENLRRAVGSGLSCLPHPRMEAGDAVEITSGPLRNVQGVVVRVRNENRLIVTVTLLQRSIAVEMNRDSVFGRVDRSIPAGAERLAI